MTWVIIGSGIGMSPVQNQIFTGAKDDFLSIGPLGNMTENVFENFI